MKKNTIIFLIILSAFMIIIINMAFHWLYFNNLNKNTRITTPEEEILIKQILKQSNISFSNLAQSHIYIKGNTEFAQIEITQNNSKLKYVINLKTKRIIKR